MSKELSPLKALLNLYVRASVHCPIDEISIIVDELYIIRTALKALEIIKETRVDTNLIKLSKDYNDYCSAEVSKLFTNMECPTQKGITEEEYDLLKEVLL